MEHLLGECWDWVSFYIFIRQGLQLCHLGVEIICVEKWSHGDGCIDLQSYEGGLSNGCACFSVVA